MSDYTSCFSGWLVMIGVMAIIAAVLALVGWVLMLIWNAAVVPWLGVPALTFWYATGVVTIIWLLGVLVRGK